MDNPITLWRQATSNPKWKALPENEKKALRESFLSKYKDAPEDIRVGATITSASSIDEIFNLPEFEQADDDTKKKYLKGYIHASKGSIGKGLDILSEGALRKYKGTASVAGLKRIALSANRLRQEVSRGMGISTEEDIAKTDAALEQANKEAARSPLRAITAEIGGNIALGAYTGAFTLGRGVAKTLPYLRNIAPVAGGMLGAAGQSFVTEPVTVKGGTPEERKEAYRREKTRQATTSALLSFGGDIVTSPKTVEWAGDFFRWLKPTFVRTKEAKLGDIADDVLRAERSNLENVAAGTSPTREQIRRGIITQREALKQSPEEVLYTGAKAPALRDTQISNAGERAPSIVEAQLSEEALRQAKTIQAQKFGDITTPAKTYKDQLWAEARKEGGLLNRAVPNARNYIGTNIEKVLNTDLALDNSVRQIPAVKEVLDRTTGENITRPVTLDQLAAWKRNILEAKITSPGAAKSLDAISNILDSPLTQKERIAVKNLFTTSQDLDEVAGGVKKAVKYITSKETPLDDINRVISNPVTLKPLKAAIAADITTTLNLEAAEKGAKEIAVAKLFDKYGTSKDTIKKIFRDEPKFVKAFDTLMESGKAAAQMSRAFNTAASAQEVKGIKGIFAGGAGGATGLRTAAAGGIFDTLTNLLNIQTRKILRASFTDKKLAIEILNRAEKIQKGRVDYVKLWDEMLGARGVSRRLAGININEQQEVVAGEEQPVQPPAPEQAPPSRENLTNAVDSGTIEETLSSVNINPKFVQVVYDIAGIESNFNPDTDLKNPNSSAQGPFQITEGTWDYITKSEVTKEDGTKVAGLGLETALGRPLDKNSTADHALVAAAYMRKNYEGLTEAGIKGTAPNLYVAHAWGLDGAKKLFKYRGKNVAIEDIMSMEAIKGHPKFAKPGMTVDQVLQNTIKYFKERRDNKGKSALIEAVNANVS